MSLCCSSPCLSIVAPVSLQTIIVDLDPTAEVHIGFRLKLTCLAWSLAFLKIGHFERF